MARLNPFESKFNSPSDSETELKIRDEAKGPLELN